MEIKITCTKEQLKRAKQLWYAKTIGFNIRYEDYKRWKLL